MTSTWPPPLSPAEAASIRRRAARMPDRPIPRSWTGWQVEPVDLPNGVRTAVRLCPFDYYPITRPLGWIEHDQVHERQAGEWKSWYHSRQFAYFLNNSSWPDLRCCGRCGAHVLDDKPDEYRSFLDREPAPKLGES